MGVILEGCHLLCIFQRSSVWIKRNHTHKEHNWPAQKRAIIFGHFCHPVPTWRGYILKAEQYPELHQPAFLPAKLAISARAFLNYVWLSILPLISFQNSWKVNLKYLNRTLWKESVWKWRFWPNSESKIPQNAFLIWLNSQFTWCSRSCSCCRFQGIVARHWVPTRHLHPEGHAEEGFKRWTVIHRNPIWYCI